MPYIILFLISFCAFVLEMLLIRTIFVVFPGGLTTSIVAFSSFGFALGGFAYYFVKPKWRSRWPLLASFSLALMAVFFLLTFWMLGSELLRTSEYSLAALFFFISAFFAGPGFYASFIFSYQPHRAGKAYAFDLFGACVGSILSLVALELWGRGAALTAVMFVLLAASAYAATRVRLKIGLGAAAIFIPFCFFASTIFLRPLVCEPVAGEAPYTGHRSSSLVELSWKSGPLDMVLRSNKIKISDADRRAVKASYLAQLDCRGYTMTVDYDDKSSLKHLEQEIHSLPFLLRPFESGAFFGSGLGMDVIRAEYFGVKNITAFEINPFLIKLEREFLGERSHYAKPNVNLIVGDSRRQITVGSKKYDLIYISSSKNYGRVGTSPATVLLNRQLTMEALQTYWDRLTDEGILFAVDNEKHVLEMSANLSVLQGHTVLAFDEAGYAGYLVSKKLLDDGQRQRLLDKAELHGWRLKFGGIKRTPNRNLITDDMPNFHNRFVRELLSANTGWFRFAFVFIVVIVAGLLLSPWIRSGKDSLRTSLTLFIFWIIGITFISTQVAFLYSLELLFEIPTYTVALTLVLMLVSAAGGALMSRRIKVSQEIFIPGVLSLMLLSLYFFSNNLVYEVYPADLWSRLAIAVLIVCPVSFLMGFLFPLHMGRLPERFSAWIPIFIGINGIGALIGALIATITISEIGISAIYFQNAIGMALLAAAMISIKISDR